MHDGQSENTLQNRNAFFILRKVLGNVNFFGGKRI